MTERVHIPITSEFDEKGFQSALKAVEQLRKNIVSLNKEIVGIFGKDNFSKVMKNAGSQSATTRKAKKETQELGEAVEATGRKAATAVGRFAEYEAILRKANTMSSRLNTSALDQQKRLEQIEQLEKQLTTTKARRASVEEKLNAASKRGTKDANAQADAERQLAKITREVNDLQTKRKSLQDSFKTDQRNLTMSKTQLNDLKAFAGIFEKLGADVDPRLEKTITNLSSGINHLKSTLGGEVFSGAKKAFGALSKEITLLGINVDRTMQKNTKVKNYLTDLEKAAKAAEKEVKDRARYADMWRLQRDRSQAAEIQDEEKHAQEISKLQMRWSRSRLQDKQREEQAMANYSEHWRRQRDKAEQDDLKQQAAEEKSVMDMRMRWAREQQKDRDASARATKAEEDRVNKGAWNLKGRFAQQEWNEYQAGVEAARQRTIAFLQTIQRMVSTLRSAFSSMAQNVRSFSTQFSTALRGAFTSASAHIQRFASSSSAFLRSFRNGLNSSGAASVIFGKNVAKSQQSASEALQRTAAGWSLLLGGNVLNQYGRMALGGFGLNLDEYMGYERAALKTAVSGSTDISMIDQLVFGLQRGKIGGQSISLKGYEVPPVTAFSSEEIATNAYYLTSALGLQLRTTQDLQAVATMLAPMMQVAAFNQTDPQSVIKGALNVGMQFGYDPRNTQQAGVFGEISTLMGYLANVSTMEVPDLQEMFKMVGPLFHTLSGPEAGAGLNDAFAASFFASEVGLKGGNIGRGLDRFLSTLLHPTAGAIKLGYDTFKDQGFESATADAWQNFWFDSEGYLKDGFHGFISKFLTEDGVNPASVKLFAEFFTQNAARALTGIGSGMKAGGAYDKFMAELTAGNYEAAMKLFVAASEETNETVFANWQNLKNAWFEVSTSIVESIKGPLVGAFKTFADLLRSIADVLWNNPALGRFIATVTTAVGVVLTLVGSILSFAGVILVLQRAFLMTHGAASVLFGIFAAIPHVLLLGLPVLAALGAAATVLYTAWEHNFLGLKDVTDSFTNDFQGSVFTKILPTLQNVLNAVSMFAEGFVQLIRGIFLGVGKTDVLSGVLGKLFGEMLGGYAYGALLNLQKVMVGVRKSIMDFFDGVASKAPKLMDFVQAFQGFIEMVLFDSARVKSLQSMGVIGHLFGLDNVDELASKFRLVAGIVRETVHTIVSYVSMLKSSLWDGVQINIPVIGTLGEFGPLKQAFENIKQIIAGLFSGQGVTQLLNMLKGGVAGFTMVLFGFANALKLVTGFIVNLDKHLASIGERWVWLANVVNHAATLIGVVGGSLLAVRLLMTIGPLQAITKLVLSFASALVQLGINVATAAIRLALWVAGLIVSIANLAIQTTMIIANAVAQTILTAANLALAAAEEMASGGALSLSATLQLVLASILAIIAAVAVITLAFIGLAAILVVNEGLTNGWRAGLVAFLTVLTGVWAVLSVVVQGFIFLAQTIAQVFTWFVNLVGISNEFYAVGVLIGIGLASLIIIFAAISAAVLALSLAITGALTAALLAVIATLGAFLIPIGLAGLAVYAFGEAMASLLGFDSIFEMLGSGWDYVALAATKAANVIKDVFTTTKLEAIDASIGIMKNAQTEMMGGEIPSSVSNVWADKFAAASKTGEWWTVEDDSWDVYFKQQSDAYRATQQEAWANRFGGNKLVTVQSGHNTQQITMDPLQAAEYERTQILKGTPASSKYLNGQLYTTTQSMATAPESLKKFVFDKTGFKWEAIQEKIDMFSSLVTGDTSALLPKGDFSSPTDMSSYQMLGLLGPNTKKVLEDMRALKAAQSIAAFTGVAGVPSGTVNGLGMDSLYEAINADLEEALATADEAAQNAEALKDFNNQMVSTLASMTLPQAMRAMFSQGMKGGRGTSLAEGMGLYSDAIAANIPESATWSNIYEGIADVVGLGGGATNVAGVNMNTALKSDAGFQKWAAEQGVSVDDLIKGVPKYTYDEAYMPLAFGELMGSVSGMGSANYNVMDHLGTDLGIGYQGTDWAALSQFAISNESAGIDWNLVDFYKQEWDMTTEEVAKYLQEHGVNPFAITNESFGTLGMSMGSSGGAVSIFDENWYNWWKTVTADGTDMMIEVTEAQFARIPEAIRMTVSNNGGTFVLVGDAMKTDINASAVAVRDEFETNFGKPLADTVAYWTDASGNALVSFTDTAGKAHTVAAPVYEGWKAAMQDIKTTAESTAGSLAWWHKEYREYLGEFDEGGGATGDGTGGPATDKPKSSKLTFAGYKAVYANMGVAMGSGGYGGGEVPTSGMLPPPDAIAAETQVLVDTVASTMATGMAVTVGPATTQAMTDAFMITAQTAGTALTQYLGDWIVITSSSTTSAVQSLVNSIISILQTADDSAYLIGYLIADGLAQGMYAGLNFVIAAATALSNAAAGHSAVPTSPNIGPVAFANGGYTPGGIVQVHKNELVHFPKGSRVYNTSETSGLMNGFSGGSSSTASGVGDLHIHFERDVIVRRDEDLQYIVSEVNKELGRKLEVDRRMLPNNYRK